MITNPSFGFQCSAEGGGHVWSNNNRENQITPKSIDPVTHPAGEAIYCIVMTATRRGRRRRSRSVNVVSIWRGTALLTRHLLRPPMASLLNWCTVCRWKLLTRSAIRRCATPARLRANFRSQPMPNVYWAWALARLRPLPSTAAILQPAQSWRRTPTTRLFPDAFRCRLWPRHQQCHGGLSLIHRNWQHACARYRLRRKAIVRARRAGAQSFGRHSTPHHSYGS